MLVLEKDGRIRMDVGKHFHSDIPDKEFERYWRASASDIRIRDAMRKARLWLDKHQDRTALDAARIISSLLNKERLRLSRKVKQ